MNRTTEQRANKFESPLLIQRLCETNKNTIRPTSIYSEGAKRDFLERRKENEYRKN